MTQETSVGCRFCAAPLTRTFVDLGMSPLCQTHLEPQVLNKGESFYPLHVFICEKCLLVQLQQYVTPDEIFTEYAYFSSFSDTLLKHAAAYVDAVVPRFGLGPSSKVIEVASNDGYLLQNFVKRGIPVEFQHLMRMMRGNQFDTIYQEHFSYLTLSFVVKLFAHHGLRLFDVEEISTHGGSLRIFAGHADESAPSATPAL